MAGWRHTLAITWVRENEKPAAVLERLWTQVAPFKIACKTALLDRYFFTVPVMKWLQNHDLPFIPVVMRGRKPKPGTKAKGLRGCRNWMAGAHSYTHRAGTESVDFQLVVTYKSYHHHRTKKRHSKKLFFATWKGAVVAGAGARDVSQAVRNRNELPTVEPVAGADDVA